MLNKLFKTKTVEVAKPEIKNLSLHFELMQDGNIHVNLVVPKVDYTKLSDEELSHLVGTYSIFLFSIAANDAVRMAVLDKVEEQFPVDIAGAILEICESLEEDRNQHSSNLNIDEEEAPLIRPSEVFKQ